jgi:hypothetical protein
VPWPAVQGSTWSGVTSGFVPTEGTLDTALPGTKGPWNLCLRCYFQGRSLWMAALLPELVTSANAGGQSSCSLEDQTCH